MEGQTQPCKPEPGWLSKSPAKSQPSLDPPQEHPHIFAPTARRSSSDSSCYQISSPFIFCIHFFAFTWPFFTIWPAAYPIYPFLLGPLTGFLLRCCFVATCESISIPPRSWGILCCKPRCSRSSPAPRDNVLILFKPDCRPNSAVLISPTSQSPPGSTYPGIADHPPPIACL